MQEQANMGIVLDAGLLTDVPKPVNIGHLFPFVSHSCFTATLYYLKKLKSMDSPWAEV